MCEKMKTGGSERFKSTSQCHPVMRTQAPPIQIQQLARTRIRILPSPCDGKLAAECVDLSPAADVGCLQSQKVGLSSHKC